MPEPIVDVIIPVHSSARPIARAAASVLLNTNATIRVNVIAHNIDPEVIRRNLGSLADDHRLRLLHLQDGIPSPAGPMNYGISASTAKFITFLGSDDEFAPGAIDSWLKLQAEHNAEVVIAKIQLVNGQTDPYPPVRFGNRIAGLDLVRDRLSYRSAPLGLVNRTRFHDLRFGEGLASGEDLVYSLTLWHEAKSIAYDLYGPPYVGHDDADDRVTHAVREISSDFAFLDLLEQTPWFLQASRPTKEAIIAKLIRIHFFDAIAPRITSRESLAAYRVELSSLASRLIALAPSVTRFLSLADLSVIVALSSGATSYEAFLTLLNARSKYRTAAALFTRNPLHSLRRCAPIRTLLPGLLITKSKRIARVNA